MCSSMHIIRRAHGNILNVLNIYNIISSIIYNSKIKVYVEYRFIFFYLSQIEIDSYFTSFIIYSSKYRYAFKTYSVFIYLCVCVCVYIYSNLNSVKFKYMEDKKM